MPTYLENLRASARAYGYRDILPGEDTEIYRQRINAFITHVEYCENEEERAELENHDKFLES